MVKVLNSGVRGGLVCVSFVILTLTVYLAVVLGPKDDQQRITFLRAYGVPGISPLFSDLAVVTSGIEVSKKGMDPLLTNPIDPFMRPMNYPRIWILVFGWLNVGLSDTKWIGFFLTVILASSYFWLFKASNLIGKLCLSIATISPVVFLLVERCNVDVVIFTLCVVSALFIARELYIPAFILIVFASFLKLYPAILLVVFWVKRPSTKNFIASASGIMLFLAYCVWYLSDIKIISAATPRPNFYAYGQFVLSDFWIQQYGWNTLRPIILVINSVIVASTILVAYLNERKKAKIESSFLFKTPDFTLLLVGALIFIGSFLVGNNWEYRLVFLLFMIPGLLNSKSFFGENRFLSNKIIPLVSTFYLLYNSLIYNILSPVIKKSILLVTVKEAFSWLLFIWCLYLIFTIVFSKLGNVRSEVTIAN